MELEIKHGKTKLIIDKLIEIVSDYPAPVYLVGGCVRDILINEVPGDIDLCIDQENGADLFCSYLKNNWSKFCSGFAVFPRYGTAKFDLTIPRGESMQIECVMPRKETYNLGPRKPDSVQYTSIEEDALRRDFCCNALYYDLKNKTILDPTKQGLKDLKDLILRTPLEPIKTFTDDPLRMLRAIRFSYKKLHDGRRFTLCDDIKKSLKDYPEYYLLSMERVKDEFSKMIMGVDPSSCIRDLHKYGLLKYIIPELEESWGFNQNSHYHNLNLTEHTLKVLDGVKGQKDEILLLAALLHDISKYKNHSVNKLGEFSFHGHEIDSSNMAVDILKRLKYDNSTIDQVKHLIQYHMILKPYYDYSTHHYKAKESTTRKIITKIKDIDININNKYVFNGSFFSERLFRLIDSDNEAHSPKFNMPRQIEDFVEKYNCGNESEKKKINIDGNRIIKEFQVSGKSIGEIKEIITMWIRIGYVNSEDEAFDKFKEIFIKPGEKIYVWKDYASSRHRCSLIEPTKKYGYGGSGGSVVLFSAYPYLNVTDNYIISKCIPNQAITLEPKDHVELYKKLKRVTEGRKIIREIGDKLNELADIEQDFDPAGMGFEEVVLVMDRFRDLSGKVVWNDFIDEIF